MEDMKEEITEFMEGPAENSSHGSPKRETLTSEWNTRRTPVTRKCLFASIALNAVLSVLLICLVILFIHFSWYTCLSITPEVCLVDQLQSKADDTDDDNDIFKQISRHEIQSILHYLFENKSFQLSHPESLSHFSQNSIYAVELAGSRKQDVLDYISGNAPMPEREAKVTVFYPLKEPPIVQHLIVGPLSKPAKAIQDTAIPYKVRQVSYPELWSLYKRLSDYKELDEILMENFGAAMFNCIKNGTKKCVTIHKTPLSSAYTGERKMWLSLYYDIEYYTLHPIDMFLLMNMNSLNSSDWFVETVWYQGQLYGTFQEFITLLRGGKITSLHQRFPESGQGSSSLARSLWKPKPKSKTPRKRPPLQFEPNGHRYMIKGELLQSEIWHFRWKINLSNGPRLIDIRFKGEKIIYELSLQEIAVIYTGHNPVFATAGLADSSEGLGIRMGSLVPGVDCPSHASFLDAQISSGDFLEGANYLNSICVFELNTGLPLRRHYCNSPGHAGVFYGGLQSTPLVFRTIFAIGNYDYILDYVFYENGVIEARIHQSGYVLTSFPTEQEAIYTMNISENAAGHLHLHLFHFKADIDVMGTENRYAVYEVSLQNASLQWASNKAHSKFKYNSHLKRTEREAAFKFSFDTPKQHVIFSERHRNIFGQPRGYRISSNSWANKLLPENNGFEKSISWARYQLAITKQKDNEQTSSSMNAIFDAAEPVVDFEGFLADDENIVDKDLVAWITIGDYHLPTSEDVPNVATAGKSLSFTLSPFNYFSSDPSMESLDGIYMAKEDSLDSSSELIKFDLYDNYEENVCLPENFQIKEFVGNGSKLFMQAP
ncbi:hypothetical protein ACJMK2_043882 [Sinanodonta woodiana]|uniref:Amine oxidase n=1 Tax=Sinanodonta woodiana TaxID=1069815 RepID=A0ABD3VZ32_SINWO